MKNDKPLQDDPEFRSLTPPLTTDDYDLIEQKVIRGNITTPVYTWKNMVIAEYNIYDICISNKQFFYIKDMNFQTRSEAICWVCNHYINSDYTCETMKKYLVGKHFNCLKSVTEVKLQSTSQKKLVGYIYQTAEILAKQYSMSSGTVYKYGTFSHSIDILYIKETALTKKILSGSLKISHENVIELSRLPAGHLKNLNENLSKGNIDHIRYSDVRQELLWKKIPTPHSKPIHQSQSELPIKQLPKYDPDSEISGLTFTIPSWISSINRTCSNANFKSISLEGKNKLLFQLQELHTAIELIQKTIKENCNG